jgi:hypothetical protein
MTHCESPTCTVTFDDATEGCDCTCDVCPTPRPWRIFSGGYWFHAPNSWGHREHATVYPNKNEAATFIRPATRAWPIQDPPPEGPVHCERCGGAAGVAWCACGCDDCDLLNVALGVRVSVYRSYPVETLAKVQKRFVRR